MSNHQVISVHELAKRNGDRKVDVIDVRTPPEFREVCVAMARNVPLDTLDPHAVMQSREGSTDEQIYVICKGGMRGAKACQKFIDAGFTNVVNVEGGTDAWAQAGLPVIRGNKTISLERQVRIIAGFLIMVSAILGIIVHPYFSGLSAFVGGGLMFAGIIDSCAMGMLIAKMPWNQDAENGACSA